jgi:hypothetical protein
LVAWLDASDTSNYSSSGGNLISITDKSGVYGSNMTVGGTPQVLTGASGLNSLNIFYFNGAGEYLQSSNYSSQAVSGNHWAIGVFRFASTNSTQDSFWSYETNASPKRDYAVSSANSSNGWPGELDLDALSSNRISNTIGNAQSWTTGVSRNTWAIVASNFNKSGNQISIRVNGANAFTPVNDYTNSLQSNQELRLMRNRSSQELAGNMAEFFTAGQAPGTGGTDISYLEQAEGYLAWKWGLVGNLPSGHPYKNSRPTIPVTPTPTPTPSVTSTGTPIATPTATATSSGVTPTVTRTKTSTATSTSGGVTASPSSHANQIYIHYSE